MSAAEGEKVPTGRLGGQAGVVEVEVCMLPPLHPTDAARTPPEAAAMVFRIWRRLSVP